MRPTICHVRPEWVDHYGHMNLAYYLVAFDLATDLVWPDWGLGAPLREAGFGTFAVESWQGYRREVTLGMPLAGESVLADYDHRRLLVKHRLYHGEEGWLSAENEVLFLCVNLATRRAGLWPEATLARFAEKRGTEAPERLRLTRVSPAAG